MTKRSFFIFLLCIGMLQWGVVPVSADNLDPIRKLIERGKYADAKDKLWDIVYKDKEKNNLEARTLLGDCYRHQNRDKDALKHYEAVIEKDPKHVDARLNMGLSLLKLKRRSDAIAVYRSVVEELPEHSMAQYYLGLAFNANADMEYAFDQYKILKRLDPKLAKQLYDIIFLR